MAAEASQMMHMRSVRAAVLVAGWCLMPASASAQNSLQVPLQFDFLNPGARSLAIGSAFTALADDATAAFTNPAGLLILSRPEVSAEGRLRRITTRFLERGRLSGSLTNRGDDTFAGAQYGESTADTGSPSFLSFVYPKGTWAIAVYRHELVKIRDTFQSRGVFQDVTDQFGTLQIRELPLNAIRDVDLSNYGMAAAYRVNRYIGIGAGVSLYHLKLESSFRRYATVGQDPFAAPDYSAELFAVTQNGDDTDVAFNAGAQITVNRKLGFGIVYRRGPAFEVGLEEAESFTRRAGTMRVPSVLSSGVMIRPSETLMFAFDYAFVKYSALVDDYITMQASTRANRFVVDDGNEFHGGVEYILTALPGMPALRFGSWYDPDHAVRYDRSTANDAFDDRFAAILPGGENLIHYTAGLGLSLSPKFEVNVAGDFTAKRKTVSSSIIYRF